METFARFSDGFEQNMAGWKAVWDSEDPQADEWPNGWKEKLNSL